MPLAEPLADSEDPLPENSMRVPICKSEDLLKGNRLVIRHGSETYILRVTKSGKLLLTK